VWFEATVAGSRIFFQGYNQDAVRRAILTGNLRRTGRKITL
jgi:hypothetical protein